MRDVFYWVLTDVEPDIATSDKIMYDLIFSRNSSLRHSYIHVHYHEATNELKVFLGLEVCSCHLMS